MSSERKHHFLLGEHARVAWFTSSEVTDIQGKTRRLKWTTRDSHAEARGKSISDRGNSVCKGSDGIQCGLFTEQRGGRMGEGREVWYEVREEGRDDAGQNSKHIMHYFLALGFSIWKSGDHRWPKERRLAFILGHEPGLRIAVNGKHCLSQLKLLLTHSAGFTQGFAALDEWWVQWGPLQWNH